MLQACYGETGVMDFGLMRFLRKPFNITTTVSNFPFQDRAVDTTP